MRATVMYAAGDVRIEQIDGHFIPVAARIKLESVSPNGFRFSLEGEYRRWDVDFRPPFDAIGAFTMAVPPDTQVRNEDVPGRKWRFQNGSIVPAD
jgi:hypothetical protein